MVRVRKRCQSRRYNQCTSVRDVPVEPLAAFGESFTQTGFGALACPHRPRLDRCVSRSPP